MIAPDSKTGKVSLFAIDDGGNAAVRIDLEKPRAPSARLSEED